MQQDPFGDPFRPDAGWNQLDLFRRRGGGVRAPRKTDSATGPESEPERASDGAGNAAGDGSEEEAPGAKVVLKNPRWEIQKVGFNEETDISVEAEIPDEHAHKTRVEFELFAKTPNGPEAIVKVAGNVEAGKAQARIPVYIPRFLDEFGNLLNKVEYFFTAKHSESDLLKDEGKTKEVEEMADPLLECHILQDVTFATGSGFPNPGRAAALKSLVSGIREWKAKHKGGKLVVFGHADATGLEEKNKTLSERRAAAIHAFLIKDAASWETLYHEDKWGLASTQELLKFAGHDPGAIDGQDGPRTQAAVRAFQGAQGLPATGQAEAATRKSLYAKFMGDCNPEPLGPKDFDSIDSKAHAGCSEFNRLEDKAGSCAENRRVAVLLLKSTKNFPIQYPCKQGDVAPCRKQLGRKGERRTKGFGCLFYDKLVQEYAGNAEAGQESGRALFSPHARHPFGYDAQEEIESEDLDGNTFVLKGDPGKDYLSVESAKTGLVELHYEKMTGSEVCFSLKNPAYAAIKVVDPSSMPIIVEITASRSFELRETILEARAGSADGKLLTEIGLVILPPLSYQATYIRVEDPKSPATKLSHTLSKSVLESELNRLYKPAAAKWTISGKDKVTEIEYDSIRNGCLDLEPGVDSEELRKIVSKIPKNGVNVVHVHELRWSYFLAKPAFASDLILTLRDYKGYLDFIGNNIYKIEDTAGNSLDIEVASVDKAKHQLHLTRPIGLDLKMSDSPALIWPLGGLSGNPSLISDSESQKGVILYAAHELGHTMAGFFDLAEKANVMFGVASGGEGLRHRPITKYYYPDQTEEQWKSMRS